MITLYKFRSLENDRRVGWAEDILRTKEFHCARFWELNDPMEGVFTYDLGAVPSIVLDEICNKKSGHVICSFSGQPAFQIPFMWGYYANGFKGIAVELEVEEDEVEKVKYSRDVVSYVTHNSRARSATMLKRILTTKLKSWRHEDEYRFLAESNQSRPMKIGQIKAVHFGLPYRNVGNVQYIISKSDSLSAYFGRARRLVQLARVQRVQCFAASIVGGAVISKPLDDDDLE